MYRSELFEEVFGQIMEMPIMDAHTHLVGGNLGARGLHDILLYHMAISDLYAAGCPSGARLTQYPQWPTIDEAHSRIREALPYLKYVRGTWISSGVRKILSDLYGFDEPVCEDNWESLDAMIRERADDTAWQREIVDRTKIRRICTEYARREDYKDRDILQYSLEWAFFTRSQWGEYDTALYEVERCWGRLPESPTPIGSGGRAPADRTISTLSDVHEAIQWYVDHIPADEILGIATHLSTDIDYRYVSDSEMESALSSRASAGQAERDIYASYVNEAFMTAFEKKLGDKIGYQFSFAAEPLPFETASRLSQKTIAQLADMISRHPGIRFQCHVASRHANQSLCTLCRELPNFSLIGYWWHNFFPSSIRQVMEERMEMLPTNKYVGYFSDAYCIEWSYAKANMVKNELAAVITDKIERGHFDMKTGLGIAAETLYETPQTLLGMVPANRNTSPSTLRSGGG